MKFWQRVGNDIRNFVSGLNPDFIDKAGNFVASLFSKTESQYGSNIAEILEPILPAVPAMVKYLQARGASDIDESTNPLQVAVAFSLGEGIVSSASFDDVNGDIRRAQQSYAIGAILATVGTAIVTILKNPAILSGIVTAITGFFSAKVRQLQNGELTGNEANWVRSAQELAQGAAEANASRRAGEIFGPLFEGIQKYWPFLAAAGVIGLGVYLGRKG